MKTKPTNIIQRLCLFLFALVLTAPAWAQGGNGTEVVSISSAADWKTFCQRVNHNGEPFLNAKLTQDVDLGGEIVMLGSVSYPYSGTFDGNGHTLKFNWNAGEDNQIAPFYYVENATIKNLRTQGKITTKGYGLSGMVYIALGTTTITGCISDVDITGGNGGWNDSQAAGMVQAVAYGASVHITDCLVKGRITDNADESERTMAGFVFFNGGTYTLTRCLYVGKNNAPNDKYSKTFGTESGISATFTDCYYLNPCGKAQGKQVTAEQLKSGEMAKLLQGDRTDNVWGQTLGTDNEPQLSATAKHVYKVAFTYNGKEVASRYANRGGNVGTLPTPQEILGVAYNTANTYKLVLADGFYAEYPIYADRTVAVDVIVNNMCEIATKEDWKKFGDFVRSGEGNLNAKLTADLNLGTDIQKIGSESTDYRGTFDGQGHTITIDWNGNGGDYFALFPFVTDATIKNLRVTGQMTSDSEPLGVFAFEAGGNTTFSGCVSDVKITNGNTNSSYCAAGMVLSAYSEGKITFKDCIVAGDINGTVDNSQQHMGGFVCGQADDATCTFNNCLYTGTNNAKGGYAFAPKPTLNNCYYVNAFANVQGTPTTAEQLASGYVAWMLQSGRAENVWGQTLGTDNEPQLSATAKHVYKVAFTYNGKEVASRYANRGGNVGTLPTPQEILGVAYNTANTYKLVFADGFYAEYPIDADRTVAVDVIVNNMCEIATKEDWKKFGELVRSGERNLNAKLTVDLNLGTDIQKIGSESTGYSGTFDGQGHTITIDWNAHGTDTYVALFPFVTNATIKNLRVTGKMTSDSKPLSVFSLSVSGTTTYEHCISDVKITSGNKSSSNCAAGMVLSADHYAKITFNDCIVAGDINGTVDNSQQNMGGFVSAQADDATCTFNNCLYTGTNNAKGGYAFAPKPTLNNCYYVNAFANVQGTPTTAEQLASGYVAWMLQSGRAENVWGQTLGTDNEPQLTAEADKRIYRVQFTHNGQVKTASYANSGKTVSLPDLAEFISEGYNPHHYYALAFGDGFTPTTPVDRDCSVPVTVTEEDYYEIASAADWKTFCNLINSAEQPSVDTKLKNDIDLGTEINMVGMRGIAYTGTFDGQGHTITIDWNAHGTDTYVALFPFVTNATIKNLRVTGKMTSDSKPLSVFSLAARGTTTYEHCISDVKITSGNTNSSYCAAGMVLSAHPESKITFNDCIVAGDINGTVDNSQQNMGGFVSAQADDATCTFNNCLYTGTNNAKGGYAFAPKPTLNNCYYVNAFANVQGTPTTAEQLASGYVAWMLQSGRAENVWGQTLGTDATPLPTDKADKRIYRVQFTHNGKEVALRYANNGQGIHGTLPTAEELLGAGYNPKLTYALNFGDFTANTPVTADKTVDVTVTVSGTFPIATAADWKEFCDLVESGQTRIDAKLTQDVDLCKEINTVGNSIEQYKGTFDGQGHTLSFDWTSQGGFAPFDFVNSGTIKNLRTKGKITTSSGEASGLLGNAYGATTISNCVSDVETTSSIDWDACKAAGLVQTVGYNGKVTVTDCVVKGNINATTEKGQKGMAGFVYELGDGGACTLTNCLYVGENNGTENSYTFAPAGVTLNNCYYLNPCGEAQGTPTTAEQLASGYVAWMLQSGRAENVWGQTLGTDATPLPTDKADKRVCKVEFTYDNKVAAVRYANRGGNVTLPTAKDILGPAYDAAKTYALTFSGGFSETTVINSDEQVQAYINGTTTGIDGVTHDATDTRGAVYNLQGVRVAESSDAETLRRLPAGVYVVRGKKFVVR